MRAPLTTAALTLALLGAAILLPATAEAAVKEVPVGILFSHAAPDAGRVSLAGSFNGWNVDRNPMAKGDDGVWTIVMALKPGQHDYKFVVDGNWVADAGNPDSTGDGYGGTNSVVNLDADGHIVAAPVPAGPTGMATELNARITLDGRYLGRYEMSRRHGLDPRYRMTRPEHKVDLNFHTDVSDVVDAYTRLRIDNTRNINFSQNTAIFDEGAIDIAPGPFTVRGFWDMEVLGLSDPMTTGGDVDMAGTMLDDHLDAGKGRSGIVVGGHPFGLGLDAYIANVHNADWYNPLDLWDDTGRDVFAARLSREISGVEVGLPFYSERDLIWMNEKWVRRTDGSAIDVFDEFQATHLSPFNSDWFEWGHRDTRFGVDLTRPVGERGLAQAEWLYNNVDQGFVTRNNAEYDAGGDLINGATDVPLISRIRNHFHGSLDWEFDSGLQLNLEHTTTRETGGSPGEALGLVTTRHYGSTFDVDLDPLPADADDMHEDWQPYDLVTSHYLNTDDMWMGGIAVPTNATLQADGTPLDADDRMYLTFLGAPPSFTAHYTELTLDNPGEDHSELLWLQYSYIDYDYESVGATAPFSNESTAKKTNWTVTGRFDRGRSADDWGHWTLVTAYAHTDDGARSLDGHTLEAILRFERDLSPRVQAIGDIRVKDFDIYGTQLGERVMWNDDFWTPYVGVRYKPHPKLDVVFAYGVDPMSFGIDYRGRHLGRAFWRDQFMYDNRGVSDFTLDHTQSDFHLGASEFAAERALEDMRAFGLRANFIF